MASLPISLHPPVLSSITFLSISGFLFPFFFNSPCSSAGASIRAARACNRHILALEADSNLYNEVLKPLKDILPPPLQSADAAPFDLGSDDDADGIPDAPLEDICE